MRILMCRPEYYGIEYEINPWMNVKQTVDHQLAVRQWESLYKTLLNCGAHIDLVPAVKGLPDMVFTANAGLLYKNQIVLPHFKFTERQGELPYFETWFKKAGYEIANAITPQTPYFEGAGDALLAGNKLFVGYGYRSDRKFYESTFFEQSNLIYCELANPYYYHIDTCFCPITDKIAIWYPAAFTPETQQRMAQHIELIPVAEEEAKRFACNAVVLDKNVILPNHTKQISAALADYGFKALSCDMDEFLKAGGACKCLTLRID